MVFVIKYYRRGVLVGSTPWADSLEKAKEVATGGLIRHSADIACVIDDETGQEAALVKR